MKSIFFNDRHGQTVLSPKEREGLKLKNISNLGELDQAEQMNINEGLLWLSKQKGEILNESFFRKLHTKLFGNVWRWAGTYRTSEKNIGIDYWKVPAEIKKLIDDARYWLENQVYSWPEFLAHFHHRLVYIHPFPNGNGRFARILTGKISQIQNQTIPSWHAHEEPETRRKKYIQALRKADMKNYQPLIKFFEYDQ